MFQTKKSFGFVVLLFLSSFLVAQNVSIRNLSLSFSRTETSSTGETFNMFGSIFFQNSPYLFSFNTITPVKQTTFLNTDGAFCYIDNELFDYSEGEETLSQTLNDFKTWFKSDVGLQEQGYYVVNCKVQDDYIVSDWIFDNMSFKPYGKITVYSDKNFVFNKLIMYSQNEELLAITTLSDFEKLDSIYIPKKIITQNYKDNKIILTTTLVFSDIRLNQNDNQTKKKIKEINNQLGDTLLVTIPQSRETKNSKVTKNIASVPQEKEINVSSFSIFANVGFSFYKKFITEQDNSDCAYSPSCSVYMAQSIKEYGIVGFIKGLERLRRCTSIEHQRDLYPLKENKHYDPLD